ncbi:MAG: MBL fold metallo-hydrolase [Planctomycetes bacterium]|nr:MBL fold metallo-hydrolase [Planctomycetota bacterium]
MRRWIACVFLLGGCASPVLPRLMRQGDAYELHQLGSRSYAFIVRSGKTDEIGSNSGFIVSGRGVVVIDTQISKEAEEMMLREIRAITSLPVTHVIDTHWHDDHVLGNGAHGMDVRILAHRDSLERMKEEASATRLPDVPVTEDTSLFDGEDRVDILAIGRAHSVGDVAVYDPVDRVMFFGDAYVRGYVGYLGEAFLREWIAGLDRALRYDIRVAVPGHGRLGGVEFAREYREYLRDFLVTAREHFRAGGAPETYVLPEKYKRYGARFFLKDNVQRAFELWKAGGLDSTD